MARLTIPIHLRRDDLDPNGHVNNAAFLTLLEEVRVRALHPVIAAAIADVRERATLPDGKPRTVVARHEIEYLQQLGWTVDPIRVEIWIARIGGSSFELCYLVKGAAGDDTVFARAASVVVYLDAATQRPRRLNQAEREAFESLTDEPIRFRPRGSA